MPTAEEEEEGELEGISLSPEELRSVHRVVTNDFWDLHHMNNNKRRSGGRNLQDFLAQKWVDGRRRGRTLIWSGDFNARDDGEASYQELPKAAASSYNLMCRCRVIRPKLIAGELARLVACSRGGHRRLPRVESCSFCRFFWRETIWVVLVLLFASSLL